MNHPLSTATLPSAVSRLSLPVLALIMTGCISVGPDHVRPEIPVYREWNTHLQANPASIENDIQTLAVWWTTLDDPILWALIDRAVKGNLGLKKGRAQVREARALRGIAVAGFLTALEGGASATLRVEIAKIREMAKPATFIPQVSTPPGNWTCLAASVAPLRPRRESFKRARRICVMFWSRCLPKSL